MSRPQHPALHCPTALIHKKIPLFIILISSRSNLRFVIPSTRMTYVISYPHSCLMNNTFLIQILKDIFGVDSITSSKHTQGLRTYIPATWPSSQIISSLVQKSSGRFIYASTFIKYADSTQHRPVERWDTVLRISNSIGDRTLFAELDCLYRYVFRSVHNIKAVLCILGALLFGQRLHLKMSPSQGEALHQSIQNSLMLGYESLIAESLIDLLTDRSRAGRYFYQRQGSNVHAELAAEPVIR